jgi:hypothetical protein
MGLCLTQKQSQTEKNWNSYNKGSGFPDFFFNYVEMVDSIAR